MPSLHCRWCLPRVYPSVTLRPVVRRRILCAPVVEGVRPVPCSLAPFPRPLPCHPPCPLVASLPPAPPPTPRLPPVAITCVACFCRRRLSHGLVRATNGDCALPLFEQVALVRGMTASFHNFLARQGCAGVSADNRAPPPASAKILLQSRGGLLFACVKHLRR